MSNFARNDNMTALFTAAGEKIGERAKIFPGTRAEWDALPLSEKIKYDYVAFAGDSQSGIVDNVPTENSENLVKSGGVYNSLDPVYNVLGAKNLLPNNAVNYTIHGITFTVNANGTVTANGTASDLTLLFLVRNFKLDNGNYILSGGVRPGVFVAVNENNGSTFVRNVVSTGNDTPFTLNYEDYDNLDIAVGIESGVTVNNEVFYPMIRLASITDDTYVPYSMTNREMTPYVQAISNPNILHNPWFQVNQRGFTTGNTNGHCVDRWRALKATTGDTTYTLNSDGTLTIDNSLGETQAYLVQRRTAKTISRIAGRKITASIMLSDGTVRSGSGTYVTTETTNYYQDDDITIQSIAQTAGQFFVLRVEAGKSITVKALKLEIGEVSTLAMDTAPDMAIELAKCQRYYQRFNATSGGMLPNLGVVSGTGTGICVMSLPSAMRTTPTLTLTGGFTVVVIPTGSVSTGTTITLNNLSNNIMRLNVAWSGSATAGQVIAPKLNNNAYIELNAEL